MGDIGTERKRIRYEPLPEHGVPEPEPATAPEPVREPEKVPA